MLLASIPVGATAQPACRVAFEEPDFAFAAGCLVTRAGRMLVVHHGLTGKLGFPAGFSQPGESAQCAAHRETWEEAGLDVEVHGMLARASSGLALYRCTLQPADTAREALPVPDSARGEVSAVTWIDPLETRASDWRFPRDYPLLLKLVAGEGADD